jgi:hypothetical protein
LRVAKVFLRPFVLEFQGRFQEILDIADDFTRFAANPNATVVELNEFEGHLFLEVRLPLPSLRFRFHFSFSFFAPADVTLR